MIQTFQLQATPEINDEDKKNDDNGDKGKTDP